MHCPRCQSSATTRRKHRTVLGYRRFSCRSCRRRFNKRTGTPFNDLQCPTDIVLLAVLWRLRYKLSFRGFCQISGPSGIWSPCASASAWDHQMGRDPSHRSARRPDAGEP